MSSSNWTQNINGKQHGWSELEGRWIRVRYSKVGASVVMSRKALRAALKKGERGHEMHCFFATGLREDKSNGVMEAIVQKNHTFIRWSGDNFYTKYSNGIRVKEFIQGYDEHAPILFNRDGNYVLELGPVAPSNLPGKRAGQSGSNKRKPPTKTTRKSRAQVAAEFQAAGA